MARVPFDRQKHPRGRGGRFIDVAARMGELGGVWHDGKRTWTVPRDQADGLKALLRDLGLGGTVEPRRTGGGTKRFVGGLAGPGETQAIDIGGRMQAIDGVWNPKKETWTVPKARADDLRTLLADLGIDAPLKPTSSGTKRYVAGVPGPDTQPDKPPVTKPAKPAPDKPSRPDKPTVTPPETRTVEAQRLEVGQSVIVDGQTRRIADITSPDGTGRRIRLTFDDGTDKIVLAAAQIEIAVEDKLTPPEPVKPTPPAATSPEQQSLASIRALAETMRGSDTGLAAGDAFRPTIGATVHLAGIPVRVLGEEPTNGQVRRHPETGEPYMVGSLAPDGSWGMTPAVRASSGLAGTQAGDVWRLDVRGDTLAVKDIDSWPIIGGDVGLINVEYPDLPGDQRQSFNQPARSFDEASTVRPWQDEVQVRAIGQAIREHMAEFGGNPDAEEVARLRQRRRALMTRPGGMDTAEFRALDARIRNLVANTPEAQREALIQERREVKRDYQVIRDRHYDEIAALIRRQREDGVVSYRERKAGQDELAKRHKKELKSLEKRTNELTTKIAALHSDVVADAGRLRQVLAEVRPGFGTVTTFKPDSARNTPGWKATEASAINFPAEWVQASRDAGELKIELSHRRGQYAHGFYGPAKLRTPPGELHTMTHELGHRVQYTARPGSTRGQAESRIDAAAAGFHKRRTAEAGTTTKRLQELKPGHGYSRDEVANEDKYFEAYVGREYGGDPREVWTMGLESVWHGVRDRYGNLQIRETDPELWDLIVGILAGVP